MADVNVLALQELAERELARKHLLPFIMRSNEHYMPGWIHKDICRRLEKFSQDVTDKKSPRLMIFMPPRHGKSEIASRTFPSWHLGKNPMHEVIAASYSGALANDFSRKVRNLMREPQYHQLFSDTQLDPDTQSVMHWETTMGGGYTPAGVSGPITGRGAHIGIIDDPIKNREEAESEVTRQSIWDWYTSTFYTRLAPGGGVLVIQTRWHFDDLSGKLLEEMSQGGDQWEVVEYPAISLEDEPYRRAGEALHPERYDLAALKKIQRAIGPRDWQALYQQKPTPDEGDFFTKGMIRMYRTTDLPPRDTLQFYTTWDLAVGTKQSNDWSVGLTVALDQDEHIWIVDMFRKRVDAGVLVDEMLDLWEIWRPDVLGIEEGVIKHSIGPFLDQRIKERNCFDCYYEPLKVGKQDKEARARSIQGRMRQGRVFFPEDAGFMAELLAELLQFPNGKHDDIVDALAHVGQMLGDLVQKKLPKAKRSKSWKDRLSKITQDAVRNAMAS